MGNRVKLLIGLVVLGLLVGAIGISLTFADEPPAKNGPQAAYSDFISRLAKALGKSEQETKNALTQVQTGRIDDALKDGKITKEQAEKARERIEQGGLGFPLNRFAGPKHPPFKGPIAKGYAIKEVAEFLNMPPGQLLQELKSGKSLAQVAQEKGKTRDELKKAIVDGTKEVLDKAVANKKITQERADNMLKRLQENLDNIIDRTFKPRGGPKSGA